MYVMHKVLCEYKDTEGNFYYIAIRRETQHCTGGATFGSPHSRQMLTSVSHTGEFLLYSCILCTSLHVDIQ